MARLIAVVTLLAVLAVAQASKDSTDKGDFFIFSKSKGAAVAAVPTVAAPVEAPAPAPCTEVCNDKCDTVFEKTCTKVPVTTTECAMVKVVNLVKQCNKKCTTITPIAAPTVTQVVAANPSAPPQSVSSTTTTTTVTTGPSTVTTAPAATATVAADAPVDSVDAGKGGKSVTVTVLAAGGSKGMMGRKLLKKESADKQDFLPLLMMAGKGMSKMQKAQKQEVQQQVVCEDVCEDVPVEGMEKQCKDVTSEVEQCTTTPKTTCVKECNCVSTPAATGKAFMLPKYGKGK